MSVATKFQTTMAELDASMIERTDEIRLVMTALVAREHVLLVGPPGTGKSMLLDAVMAWANGSKFGWLMNKFTVPEEIFGPVSVAGLKADKYLRITTGKLPEADFAFLDEVFKANSAILNTLLRILNERQFDAGDGTVRKVPLRLCVGASNEWPSNEGGKELGALFDRFVLRKTVKTIGSKAGLEKLLFGGDLTPMLSTTITGKELDAASWEASEIGWSEDGKEAMREILRELGKEGIVPGDRRKVKSVKVARAAAWLAGADSVEPDHLEVLADCLWDDPAEQPAKCAQVVAKVANPVGMAVTGCLLEAEAIMAKCNPKRLDEALPASAKLEEIVGKLKAMKRDPRAVKAAEHVAKLGHQLRVAAFDAR